MIELSLLLLLGELAPKPYSSSDNSWRRVSNKFHQWDGNLFATVSAQVDIWDPDRSEPVSSFEWGKDTVLSVRFDPGDCNVLITSGSDRSLTLYDLRMSSPARKLIMKTRCNSVCWNPIHLSDQS